MSLKNMEYHNATIRFFLFLLFTALLSLLSVELVVVILVRILAGGLAGMRSS